MLDNGYLHSKGLASSESLRNYQLEGVSWLKGRNNKILTD